MNRAARSLSRTGRWRFLPQPRLGAAGMDLVEDFFVRFEHPIIPRIFSGFLI
jgi:hypothetical protein